MMAGYGLKRNMSAYYSHMTLGKWKEMERQRLIFKRWQYYPHIYQLPVPRFQSIVVSALSRISWFKRLVTVLKALTVKFTGARQRSVTGKINHIQKPSKSDEMNLQILFIMCSSKHNSYYMPQLKFAT